MASRGYREYLRRRLAGPVWQRPRCLPRHSGSQLSLRMAATARPPGRSAITRISASIFPLAGWSEMTVFLVAKATTDGPAANLYSQNSAILWTENEYWGNTFVSSYQTHVSARFGTTRPGNNLFYARPGGGVGQDFTSTRAVHDHEADSLYVNGLRVFRQGGKWPVLGGVTGAGTIGEGINQTFFNW